MSAEKLSVQLFHGRSHPDDKLDDWGFDGPCLGPLSGVHLTYGNVGVFGNDDERITLTQEAQFRWAAAAIGEVRGKEVRIMAMGFAPMKPSSSHWRTTSKELAASARRATGPEFCARNDSLRRAEGLEVRSEGCRESNADGVLRCARPSTPLGMKGWAGDTARPLRPSA